MRAAVSPAVLTAFVAATLFGSGASAQAPITPSAPPSSLLGLAVQASQEERWCEAMAAFLALDERWPSGRAVYNAAEVAYAAGDRSRALELYRNAQQRYPAHERKEQIARRIDEVFKTMVRDGPGNACPLPPACGDWFLRAPEQCDDGNLMNGDGCDGNCTVTACGNNVTTPGEQCDDGNVVDGDGCDHTCRFTGCGNGTTTTGETCDDGNFLDGDGCDHNCSLSGCGNGVKAGAEECDDGNERDGDGCDRGCVVSRCGNGVIAGAESCDDGNTVDGDGCERTCSVTRVSAPWLGVGVASASGLAFALGGTLGALGMVSYVTLNDKVAAITTSQELYEDGDPQGALTKIDAQRAEEESARAEWNGGGQLSLVGGSTLLVAGAGGLVAGIWLALTQTEEATAAEATK